MSIYTLNIFNLQKDLQLSVAFYRQEFSIERLKDLEVFAINDDSFLPGLHNCCAPTFGLYPATAARFYVGTGELTRGNSTASTLLFSNYSGTQTTGYGISKHIGDHL
jgi:hypothetical protein